MYYSFDFAANVAYLCMDEIRKRGLQERKIFRKTVPNNGLFIKVFGQQSCTSEDLAHVHIHSVATLMQDALWSSHERIISKKAWRTINYETCTLSSLSTVLTSKSEQLLIDILDFLVQLMRYKSLNLMNAYKLGDALGKVVLGPADCGPILAEKAGHFLTRMIIEHAKLHQKSQKIMIRRIDSGFTYTEYRPICKAQGTQARAKCYDRVVFKTKWSSFDWIENTVGVQAMLDDAYDLAPDPPEKPWVSIFTSTEDLVSFHRDMSPVLYRMLREASKPPMETCSDPFATSYLFNSSKAYWAEGQIQEAFSEFHHDFSNAHLVAHDDKSNPLKKLNHSISHLKLNIKKYRSKHDLLDESAFSEDTMVDEPEYNNEKEPQQKINGATNMRNVMKKMIKMGGISQQNKDRRNNKILV